VTKCTTDSSWFVKKAAVDLITKFLSSSKSSTLAPAAYDCVLSDDDEEKVISMMFAPLLSDEACDVSQLSVCLEILENQDLLVLIFSCLHLDKVQIVERLCVLLKCLPISVSCDDETKILEILSSVCESYACWNEAKQQLVQLVTTLLNSGKILSAVVVAVWLLKRFVATLHQVIEYFAH